MKRHPVYSYRSQDRKYYNCTLELVNGKFSTSACMDNSTVAKPKVSRAQFFRDADMSMEDIVNRVKLGLMNEDAIPLAMELLL